ncbi:tRNA pseudouridine(55) synthase TruB [Patescibacteria group bacterium]|nr:tRNA pseudouridine(55) synthase TruB [Patescibacteria group bacterium]
MILNIYKPQGPTSHDIVDKVRKILKIKKVGHAGTLDPFAQGILLILTEKDTKKQSKFLNLDKTYIGTLELGKISDTYDIEGKIQKIDCNIVERKKIEKILKRFIGKIKQTPPIYSAIKIKGKKAYELARKGQKPKLRKRKIQIYNIELLNYKWPILEIKVKCSKGTYIRSLANDIGKKLKTGAYLKKLIRTEIGEFKIEDSINLEYFEKYF